MICDVCQKYAPLNSSQFIEGCKSQKVDSVSKHEKSKVHQKSVAIAAAKSKPAHQSEAGEIVITLKKEIYTKLDTKFRTVHGMIKHNRPITDFKWICDLDEV